MDVRNIYSLKQKSHHECHLWAIKLTSTMQNPINFTLIEQLGMLCLDTLQFNRHLLPRGHVGSEVNITEGTGPDFTA
jgi:hypothetical protein